MEIKNIKSMAEQFYSLRVVKTEEEMSFQEDGDISEFELLGILSYLQQVHSKKLHKELANYEREKEKTNG